MTTAAARLLPTEDRRTRRKAESRRRLLDAARRLFVERGYHATRPADVARLADVGHGTFYLHFADKRELFLAFVDEAAVEIQRELAPRVAGVKGFESRLWASLEGVLDYARRHPGVLRAAFTDTALIAPGERAAPTLRERLADQLAEGLRQGIARGELHSDYDVPLVAHAIVGLVEQAAQHGNRRRLSREQLLGNLTRFCARALLAPRAQPRERSR